MGVLAVPYLWVKDTAWDRSLWSQHICFYEALQILIRGRGKSPQARARPEARKSGAGEAALPSCWASVSPDEMGSVSSLPPQGQWLGTETLQRGWCSSRGSKERDSMSGHLEGSPGGDGQGPRWASGREGWCSGRRGWWERTETCASQCPPCFATTVRGPGRAQSRATQHIH